MGFHATNGITAYQFEIFAGAGLAHGLFTRGGGVSPAPWSSLNLGGTVGDARENVVENRRRIFETVERPVESIFDVWQVHGVAAIASDVPRKLDGPHQPADIILTNNPQITLFMRFADCVPILLCDPKRRVVAMAHAGWKGTLAKAGAETVAAMQRTYGCEPRDLLAGIGPSICKDCYEVGEEVVVQARETFPGNHSRILQRVGSRFNLDLWEANRLALMEAGMKEEAVQIAGECTAEHTDLWFSHRAERGATGRYGALIALEG